MRNAVPLITAAALPDLRGGVELFVVETRLLYPGAGGADGHQEHGLTVLVLTNPDEAARRRIRSEAPRYVGAQTWTAVLPGDDWASAVTEHLNARDAAFLDLVIELQEPSDQATLQSNSLLRQLRANGRHHLGTVVAVTSTSFARPAMAEQLGWVVAPQLSAAEAAILLHAGLAQLSAPDLIEEITAEDLAEVWGPAAQPARLVVSDADQLRHLRQVQKDGRIAVFCLDNGTIDQYRTIARDLRAAGIESPRIVVAAGLTLSGPTHADCPCVIVTAGESPMFDDPGEQS